ncbi:serine hydrolase [Solwaraspora sp. WMMD406]|uniref:serine hydrolase n=1 Tax=Solwaraspora sp. WMMD406 TaxID=3016095 RepID=UPI002416A255|nr:serine hydrolase [Solwaraspora sp. WMMD406]MDG4765772.1 serine hydrolase [Solwaraspora sp. WMMD406]
MDTRRGPGDPSHARRTPCSDQRGCPLDPSNGLRSSGTEEGANRRACGETNRGGADRCAPPIWLDTGWGYAYGWLINTEDGHLRVGKNGGATGSTAYLQMYPDDGIVVAVLTNRADGVSDSNRAEALGSGIGSLVLDTLP